MPIEPRAKHWHDDPGRAQLNFLDSIAIYQISEANLGSLIRLRDPSSVRGRDPRVVGVLTWPIWRVI